MRAKAETAKRKRRRKTPVRKTSHTSSTLETALAFFAHEVRTPLTGIVALSDLLAASSIAGRERQWVEGIKGAAEHLAAVATVFVDAAQERHGRLVLRRDVFDLGAVARAAGLSLSGRATARELAVRLDIPADLPLVVGDAVRLRAALENLIDNAVKFTSRGRVGLRVEAKARGEEVTATFTVSDTGIGVSASDLKQLFKPFSQAGAEIASRFGGAGLGLSSVRQLARAMGGDVTVQTRRGGADFVMKVRFARVATAAGEDVTRKRAAANAPRVLCVEDNPFGRVVLKTILSELGCHVEFAETGEDALKVAARKPFEAVLMDMVLPGIDGVTAIKRLRRSRKTKALRIVGVSGSDRDEKAARAAGADDFLLKPLSPRALALALGLPMAPAAARSRR
jgi:CheY-like chemotaxis protein